MHPFPRRGLFWLCTGQTLLNTGSALCTSHASQTPHHAIHTHSFYPCGFAALLLVLRCSRYSWFHDNQHDTVGYTDRLAVPEQTSHLPD